MTAPSPVLLPSSILPHDDLIALLFPQGTIGYTFKKCYYFSVCVCLLFLKMWKYDIT